MNRSKLMYLSFMRKIQIDFAFLMDTIPFSALSKFGQSWTILIGRQKKIKKISFSRIKMNALSLCTQQLLSTFLSQTLCN